MNPIKSMKPPLIKHKKKKFVCVMDVKVTRPPDKHDVIFHMQLRPFHESAHHGGLKNIWISLQTPVYKWN